MNQDPNPHPTLSGHRIRRAAATFVASGFLCCLPALAPTAFATDGLPAAQAPIDVPVDGPAEGPHVSAGDHASGYALAVVRSGDSIGAIAQRYRVDVEVLRSANGLESNTIYPDQVLRVPFIEATGGVAEEAPPLPPGFRSHALDEGETLSDVAERYDTTLQAIVGANPDLSSLDRLPMGMEVLVPPREGLLVRLQEGESVLDVLARYDLSPLELARANGIVAPGDLQDGMMLFLPGVEPSEALERLARVRELENTYVWPLHGRLTSYFGRRNLGMGTSSFHRGIDIAAPWGTPVVAARSGTVTYAGWSSQGYGNLVKIRHAGGAETWYGHFSSIAVSVGEYVGQNDTIGYVGSTGLSTGPHLHLELHDRGVAVNPLAELN